ncbi:MAG TPA: urease accessory protein UreE [Hyphomicrobiaceae bacterium]|jgi:urease accessory protein|nr:urease accessory protein UreE [Hyphomicrobiaceae bacterium]
MLRATEIVPAGQWLGPPADVVRLDYDRRTRRRIALSGNAGLVFLLDLAKAPVLAAGDGLKLEDGRIVGVEAAAERLLEIVCGDARALARIGWHLGNRHLPCEIGEGSLLIRADHVIADMVRGLGASVREHEGPFNPEGGAYATASHASHHGQGHGHGHHHDHSLSRASGLASSRQDRDNER